MKLPFGELSWWVDDLPARLGIEADPGRKLDQVERFYLSLAKPSIEQSTVADHPEPKVTLTFMLRLKFPLCLQPGTDSFYVWFKAGEVMQCDLVAIGKSSEVSPELERRILARFPDQVLFAARELSARLPDCRVVLGDTERDTELELGVYGWPGPLDINSPGADQAFRAIGVALGGQ